MLCTVKDLLEKAHTGGYAVGAFNTMNVETTRAILEAAYDMKSPVIIQVTEKTMDYTGGRAIYQLIRTLADCYFPDIPYAIHLDHGKSFEIVERALEIGFGSVMYDGSRREYSDNLMMTEKIVKLCHAKGVFVQAELGNVPYLGEVSLETDQDWDRFMTNPEQAQEFVEHTGVDALAVAIGNAHGFFKERSVPDYDRLTRIRELVNIPLVLHGASDWDVERVQRVVGMGISCFNVDTAIRVAFVGQLKQTLRGSEGVDLRSILGSSKEAVRTIVKNKIAIFGSAEKA